MPEQSQVQNEPSPVGEDVKDEHAPKDRYNLDDAFIHIDGQRYKLADLLKSLMEKSKASEP
jgi:hypothetical protein